MDRTDNLAEREAHISQREAEVREREREALDLYHSVEEMLTSPLPERVVYLRASQLAERWATTPGGLAQMRYRGTGPKHVTIPGVGIRYLLKDIEAYERGGDS